MIAIICLNRLVERIPTVVTIQNIVKIIGNNEDIDDVCTRRCLQLCNSLKYVCSKGNIAPFLTPYLLETKFEDDAFHICTELYKEIDWITDFLQANSGQSGLTLHCFNCNDSPKFIGQVPVTVNTFFYIIGP